MEALRGGYTYSPKEIIIGDVVSNDDDGDDKRSKRHIIT
jgi:hypothetical protein